MIYVSFLNNIIEEERIMPEKHFIKRLLIDNEIEEAKKILLENIDLFRQYYPKYEFWIEKSFEEIRKGERELLGIYDAELIGIKYNPKLIGTAIIIKNIYTNTIELKSFYIDDEYRRLKKGEALLEEVFDFCKKNGYKRIITSIPAQALGIVRFFLKNGFFIANQQKSDYTKETSIYILSKSIRKYYIGDPFDLIEFSKWMLEEIYNLKILSQNSEILYLREDISTKLDESVQEMYNINGRAILSKLKLDEKLYSEIEAKLGDKGLNEQLQFIFAPFIPEKLIDQIQRQNILPICKKRAFKDYRNLILYRDYDFDEEQIGGLIILIKHEYYQQISIGQDFSYIKSGNVGKFLKPNNLILFLVESQSEGSEFGIQGYGFLKSTELILSPFNKIWGKIKSKNPIFSENDLLKFAKNKDNLQILEITDFTHIININNNEMVKFFEESKLYYYDWGNYYFSIEKMDNFLENLVKSKKMSEESWKRRITENLLQEICKNEIKYKNEKISLTKVESFLNQFPEHLKEVMIRILFEITQNHIILNEFIRNLTREIEKISIDPKELIFLTFDNAFKESQSLWTKLSEYYTKNSHQIKIISSNDVKERFQKNEINFLKKKKLILIDDFVCTGNQFLTNFRKEIDPLIKINHSLRNQINILFGFCTHEIRTLILNETKIPPENFSLCSIIHDKQQLFKNHSIIQDEQFNEFIEFLKKIHPNFWAGWKKSTDSDGLGLILTSEWKIPNNTLGCLWKSIDKLDLKWKPLFE